MKTIFVILLTVMLSLSPSVFARGHKFVSGKASSITSTYVVMGDVKYYVTDDTAIYRYFKDGDSIHREKINIKRINARDHLTLKVLSREILELAVEDY